MPPEPVDAIPVNALMTPTTVPSSPTNGAVAPMVASDDGSVGRTGLVTDLLRGEWGYQGTLITDWDNVGRMVWEQHIYPDYTLAAARAVGAHNPSLTFVYVSGEGTDSTEAGRAMWARVKGRTENALLAATLARFVNAKVRKRGLHYFRGRRVRLTACGPRTLRPAADGHLHSGALYLRVISIPQSHHHHHQMMLPLPLNYRLPLQLPLRIHH